MVQDNLDVLYSMVHKRQYGRNNIKLCMSMYNDLEPYNNNHNKMYLSKVL